jgi:uncharacterized protein YbjT (DUF2867 family)
MDAEERTMTTIAITGATGFVGTALVERLKTHGHTVKGLARNRGSGTLEGTVAGDVRDSAAVAELVRGCDAVIHFAPGVTAGDDVVDGILVGTRVVRDAAREAGVGRFIFLSCMGADASARDPYLRAKWQAETIVRASETPWTVLRSSVVVGAGGTVLRAVDASVRARPVVAVPGRGDIRFQPIAVHDLARCLETAATTTDYEAQTISVGGPTFLTYRQLVDLVGRGLGLRRKKVLVPGRLLRLLSGVLPTEARPLLDGPYAALLNSGVVASPGVVASHFGFQPMAIFSVLHLEAGEARTDVPVV